MIQENFLRLVREIEIKRHEMYMAAMDNSITIKIQQKLDKLLNSLTLANKTLKGEISNVRGENH